MKKYVTLIVQTTKDGSAICAAYAYDTLKEAEHAYYSELASGSGAGKLKSDFVAVFDNHGTSYMLGSVGDMSEGGDA